MNAKYWACVTTMLFGGGGFATRVDAQTCDDNEGNSPYVCVNWSQGTPPEEGTDFVFDFETDADNPGITLLNGDLGWVVWSQVSSGNTTPDNLGVIKINPELPSSDDFEVTIAHGANPGAANVASIVLTKTGWGGYSSLEGGSINGNLAGPLVVKEDAGGAGGRCTFQIGGNASGKIVAPTVDALIIDGTLSGGVAAAKIAQDGGLAVKGNLSGTIEITDIIEDGGILAVWGDITSTAQITVADMAEGVLVRLNDESGDVAGDLLFENGIPAWNTLDIEGALTQTGSIDLNGMGVAEAAIFSIEDGGAGVIVNGGPVGGYVYLSLGPGSFSGTATFASVVPGVVGGEAYIGEYSYGGLSGSIVITGDVAGDIYIHNHVLNTGRIEIGGDCEGYVQVFYGVYGDIVVEGDATLYCTINVDTLAGDIDLQQDMYGLIETGPVNGGRVLLTGLCDGPVVLQQETGATSLVHLLGGLGSDGYVRIFGNANGDILVGPATVPLELGPITFDGFIETRSGGDLNGDITVVGCHATDDDLQLCIDGDVNGKVEIIQTDCENQVDWCCSPPCD